MTDPRVEKLARLLIEYSLKVKRGQWVIVDGPAVAAPLIRECYRHALRRGAFAEVLTHLDGLGEIFYKTAKPAQLKWISPTAKQRIEKADALCRIDAEVNTRALTGCDPKKMAAVSKAREPLMKTYMKRSAEGKLAWVLTQWPAQANAQDADMSIAEYEEFVFEAGHLNEDDPVAAWKKISRSQQALTNRLNRSKEIRIVAEDTDLTFRCEGRKWINCDGQLNFPDGEVFTAPVEGSVEGQVRFSFPAVHEGREVQDVLLVFEKGKVVRAEASKAQDFLREMIKMDEGSCRLGEAAFGTNYNITRYTRNTLFDEKIGGTVHLALGAGYPETGSKNRSGLHWDMVCDLRSGGKVYANGRLLQKDGIFENKKYPQSA